MFVLGLSTQLPYVLKAGTGTEIIMNEKKKQEYNDYVSQVTPTHNLFLNMAKAF